MGITPDYKATVERVYQITAHRMIMNLQYLPLLSLREDSSVRKIHSLPSWVPDFSAFDKHHVDPLCVAMDGVAYDVPHQTGNMPREIKENILSVQGALLDTIEEPSPYWGEVLNFQTIINITWLGLKIPSPYKNGQDRVDVLWRTLIGDTDGVASPAPQSIGQNFYNFILDQLTKALVEQFSQRDASGTDLFRNRGLFNKLKSETQAEHGFPDLDDAYNNFEKAMVQQQQTGNSAKQIPIPKIDDHFIDMAKFFRGGCG